MIKDDQLTDGMKTRRNLKTEKNVGWRIATRCSNCGKESQGQKDFQHSKQTR